MSRFRKLMETRVLVWYRISILFDDKFRGQECLVMTISECVRASATNQHTRVSWGAPASGRASATRPRACTEQDSLPWSSHPPAGRVRRYQTECETGPPTQKDDVSNDAASQRSIATFALTISPGRSAKPPVSSSWQARMKERSLSLSIQWILPMIRRDARTHQE